MAKGLEPFYETKLCKRFFKKILSSFNPLSDSSLRNIRSAMSHYSQTILVKITFDALRDDEFLSKMLTEQIIAVIVGAIIGSVSSLFTALFLSNLSN